MLTSIWNFISAPFKALYSGARFVANHMFDLANFVTKGSNQLVIFIGQGIAAYVAGSMVGTATNAILTGLSIFIGVPAAAGVALLFWGFALAGVLKACFDPRYEEVEVTISSGFESGYVARIFKELHETAERAAAAVRREQTVDLRNA